MYELVITDARGESFLVSRHRWRWQARLRLGFYCREYRSMGRITCPMAVRHA